MNKLQLRRNGIGRFMLIKSSKKGGDLLQVTSLQPAAGSGPLPYQGLALHRGLFPKIWF
ncbi:MAG: hypothetical protein IJ228_07755 [Succinivibrio sp.]|nr:hypothetical protein [Succinivibrio sp.]